MRNGQGTLDLPTSPVTVMVVTPITRPNPARLRPTQLGGTEERLKSQEGHCRVKICMHSAPADALSLGPPQPALHRRTSGSRSHVPGLGLGCYRTGTTGMEAV
ncbi:hypothetical protein DM860_002609 [Cuscuta australis]|uniref:Uncharacterized protein n=1 Tax=Cuscuta australis TaxID=267555 RepID=A0A328D2J6_9ASTE|nr:hypothetical protein DM860_002609 [Cuscuta australis]